MIQNGVCLYKITNDENYLNEAKASAQGAYGVFVRSVNGIGLAYPDHDPWFNTKLLRAYIDIAPYDPNVKQYILIISIMHMNTHVLRKASFMRTGLVKILKEHLSY